MNHLIHLIKSYHFAKQKYDSNLNKIVHLGSVGFTALVVLGVGFKFLPPFCIFMPLLVCYGFITIGSKFKKHFSKEERGLFDKIKDELAKDDIKERVMIIKDIIELQEDDILEDSKCVTPEYLIKDILFYEKEYQKYASVEISKLIKIRDDLIREKLENLTKTQIVLEQKLSAQKTPKPENNIFKITKKYLSNKL